MIHTGINRCAHLQKTESIHVQQCSASSTLNKTVFTLMTTEVQIRLSCRLEDKPSLLGSIAEPVLAQRNTFQTFWNLFGNTIHRLKVH